MSNEDRLISANAFKKVFYVDDDCDEMRFGVDGKVFVDFAAVQRAIDEAPTVDAAPVVHGRWVAVPSSNMMTGKAYKCSECNKMRYGSFMPNYCQNCGAKMDGGNEDG